MPLPRCVSTVRLGQKEGGLKYALLKWLACPSCQGTDLRLETKKKTRVPCWRGQLPDGTPGFDPETNTLEEVIQGELTCGDCGSHYPIEGGIPRMVRSPSSVPHSAHSTTLFDADTPQWEEAFLDFAQPLKPADFVGKLALDVGCGFGRGLFYAARYGAEVVGIDLDPRVLATAQKNTADRASVHLVQGDAQHPPLRSDIFDLVYAFGLLHHLADPSHAFRACANLTKHGGRFSLWVYGPRQGTSAAVSALLRGMTGDMATSELLNVSRLIATGLRATSHTPYRALRHIPGLKPIVSHLPLHDHHRWPYDIVVADIYDRLRIPVTHTFTPEELEARYVDEGFLDVQTSRRVRNTESYRATGIRR